MDIKHIRKVISQGEGLTVEFKESRNRLNRDVYETVCAFLNRHVAEFLLLSQAQSKSLLLKFLVQLAG